MTAVFRLILDEEVLCCGFVELAERPDETHADARGGPWSPRRRELHRGAPLSFAWPDTGQTPGAAPQRNSGR